MKIQRYHTFTREGSSVIERADDGEFVFHSAHADKLAAMQARAEKAEAVAAQWRDAYSRNIVVTAIANEEDDEAAHVQALTRAGQIMVEGKA